MTTPYKKRKRRWRSFEDARSFVRGLKLHSQKEWRAYSKKRKKPKTIPSQPHKTYKEEWTNWGDFLGTGNVASQNHEFLSFKEARNFVRPLKLKSFTEWQKYSRGDFPEKGTRPENIPSHPNRTYKEDWVSWGDFLGTGNVPTKQRKFLPYEKARDFVRGLNIKSLSEWRKYKKGELPEKGTRPKNIPSAPYSTYKKEWTGWGDFLGTGTVATQKRVYLPFQEAKSFATSLKLKTLKEWVLYCKGELPEKGIKPDNIPATPAQVYKKKWKNWEDWLKKGKCSLAVMAPEIAKKWHPTKNGDLTPEDVWYGLRKKVWWKCDKGHEWEGTVQSRTRKGVSCPVCLVRITTEKNCLATVAPGIAKEWHPTKNGDLTPSNVTSSVNKKVWWRCSACGNEWETYIYNRKRGVGCPECAKIKVSLSLSTPPSREKSLAYLKPEIAKEWHPTKNGDLKPEDVMPNSDKIIWWVCSSCNSEWKSKASERHGKGGHCPSCSKRFGRKKRARKKWRSFRKVRNFARKLKLRSDKQWKAFCKEGKPEDIPVTPDRIYKDQWKGWGDFLGTKRDKKFLPFEEARSFVRTLNLKSSPEWYKYSKGELKKKGKRPDNIPSNPRRQYQDEWKSWEDWLGKVIS